MPLSLLQGDPHGQLVPQLPELPEPEIDHGGDDQQGPQVGQQERDHILGIQHQLLQEIGQHQGERILVKPDGVGQLAQCQDQKCEESPEVPLEIPVEHVALGHGVGMELLRLRVLRPIDV